MQSELERLAADVKAKAARYNDLSIKCDEVRHASVELENAFNSASTDLAAAKKKLIDHIQSS